MLDDLEGFPCAFRLFIRRTSASPMCRFDHSCSCNSALLLVLEGRGRASNFTFPPPIPCTRCLLLLLIPFLAVREDDELLLAFAEALISR